MSSGFAQRELVQDTGKTTTSTTPQQTTPPLNLGSAFQQNMTQVPATGRTKLPANFPFLPARKKKNDATQMPDFIARDFVVKSGTDWYYVRISGTAVKTTAVDETRVGPYASLSQAGNYHCSCTVEPLADYIAALGQSMKWREEKRQQQFLHHSPPLQEAGLSPVYIEVGVIRVFQAAAGLERGLAAAGLLLDVASGDFQGDVPAVVIDIALGEIAKKLWRTVFQVPEGMDAPAKVKWLEGISAYGAGKALPLPK